VGVSLRVIKNRRRRTFFGGLRSRSFEKKDQDRSDDDADQEQSETADDEQSAEHRVAFRLGCGVEVHEVRLEVPNFDFT
tara:strand:+ start:202 stop:438 length:237 start_codon:yes stop_codon:yes gene_type:complete